MALKTPISYRKTERLASPFHSPETRNQAFLHIGVGILLADFRQYYKGITAVKPFDVVGKRRPYQPFNAVAFNRLAVLFGDSYAHYRLVCGGTVNYGEIFGISLFTLSEQSLKVGIFFKPCISHYNPPVALSLPIIPIMR